MFNLDKTQVLETDADERDALVRNLLGSDASEDRASVDTFVADLLQRLADFEKQFGE